MTWQQAGVAVGLVVAGTAAAASQVRPDLPQNQPGLPTVGQVRVVNAAPDEAVPVTIRVADPLPVSVVGVPTVALLPNATVGVRTGRQAWEYRQQLVATGEDASISLNAAGAEGWEAIAGSQTQGGTMWILKRPR